jgi:adenine phosphoribosyltransferase
MDLMKLIVDVPDFPRPGVMFKDITRLLAHPAAYAEAIERMAAAIAPSRPALIAGIEARGFIFGAAVAQRLGAGFVPLRKPGKLPGATHGIDYALEYGEDRIELRSGTIPPGTRVAVVDDVLATGGTLAAAVGLLVAAGAVVEEAAVLMELGFLDGRARLPGSLRLHAVLHVD